MKLRKSLIIALSASVVASGQLRADLITGSLSIGGTVKFNSDSGFPATSVTTATAVDSSSWSPLLVTGSGLFTNVPSGTPIIFSSSAWNLNTAIPITNFWTYGGFRFELSTSTIAQASGTPAVLTVIGSGIVSSNGYTPTAFYWVFSSQDPPAGSKWSFSAAVSSLNSNGQPVLVSHTITNATILSWSDPTFTLQAATNAAGPFTNVSGATSPYTNSTITPQRFFRLNQ